MNTTEQIKSQKALKAPKVYTVIKRSSKGRVDEVKGTLEELISYFGYTLEVGHSWNSKIQTNPKTIKSFINNLSKSYDEKESACYHRTSVSLKD